MNRDEISPRALEPGTRKDLTEPRAKLQPGREPADVIPELLLDVRVDRLVAQLDSELGEPELHPLALEHVGVGRAAADRR